MVPSGSKVGMTTRLKTVDPPQVGSICLLGAPGKFKSPACYIFKCNHTKDVIPLCQTQRTVTHRALKPPCSIDSLREILASARSGINSTDGIEQNKCTLQGHSSNQLPMIHGHMRPGSEALTNSNPMLALTVRAKRCYQPGGSAGLGAICNAAGSMN